MAWEILKTGLYVIQTYVCIEVLVGLQWTKMMKLQTIIIPISMESNQGLEASQVVNYYVKLVQLTKNI